MARIGVVGHSKNVKLIEDTALNDFKDLEIIRFHFDALNQLDATVDYIRSQSKYLQGIIFTGRIPYELITQSLDLQLPYIFVTHDQSNLQRSLLEAAVKTPCDIKRVSIDSIDRETVLSTYEEFGLEPDRLDVRISCIDISRPRFLDKAINFHKHHLEIGQSSIAITGIAIIYNKLQKAGLPCLMLQPTSDAIRHTIQHLLLQISSIDSSGSQIVVISIEIDMPSEYNLLLENEYQLLLERTHVSEEVYKLAQRIQGTVVEIGTNKYMIFSTRKPVEVETRLLSSIPLLQSIKANTAHTVSMGIGFGDTARQAKYNATLGLNKSLKKGGNQAYIVTDTKRIGPIYEAEGTTQETNPITDSIFQIISDQTGISVNNIYKLHCIREKAKKDHFTSKELAKEFGNSPRSMNRIIEKLQGAGYIEIDGTKVISGAGRPTRILKLLF